MFYKYYTADCVQIVNGESYIVGGCITRVFFWKTTMDAYDNLSLTASKKDVHLFNIRRIK